MEQSLVNQVAFVAVGTRGAGRGIATELGAAGAAVYVTGRTTRTQRSPMNRPETIEETAELVTAAGAYGIAVPVDHSDPDQVDQSEPVLESSHTHRPLGERIAAPELASDNEEADMSKPTTLNRKANRHGTSSDRALGRAPSASVRAIRELDHRHNDGIDVRLLWDAQTNRVSLALTDERTGESTSFAVDAGEALTAFHHPYAYAGQHHS